MKKYVLEKIFYKHILHLDCKHKVSVTYHDKKGIMNKKGRLNEKVKMFCFKYTLKVILMSITSGI